MTIQHAFETALQHHRTGRLAEAEATYRQILAADPRHADSLHLLGVIAHQTGHSDDAVELIRQAIKRSPSVAMFYANLGKVLSALDQLDEAIRVYRVAIDIKPDYAEGHTNLGNALYDYGRLDEAIAAYRRALQLRPDYAEALHPLGNALMENGQFDEAVATYRRALQLGPDSAETNSSLGLALGEQGHLDEAVAACRHGVQLQPNLPGVHNNLGRMLQARGQLDEAAQAFRRAIELNPNLHLFRLNYALLLLLRGDFETGWPLYEVRHEMMSPAQIFSQPMWDGGPVDGRSVLIHADFGFGDTLQMVRYVPLIAQRDGKVILECQPELKSLFSGVEGVSQILARGEPLPEFDLHCPMMSLPRVFGTRIETIPSGMPYLRSDPQKTALWRERLDGEIRLRYGRLPPQQRILKVGLLWAGNPRPGQTAANWMDRRRSMRLSQFTPLAGMPGVVFVSLQKGGPAEQAQTPPPGMRLLDWTGELNDFADTAALVGALDLVICVDTSVAHLAGALGKPVWLLNRFDTCWRWLLHRTDSPWYPTMRLFRQPRPGDWEPVIDDVRKELDLLVKSRGGTGDQGKG